MDRNNPQIWANRFYCWYDWYTVRWVKTYVDPDQTPRPRRLIWVYTVCSNLSGDIRVNTAYSFSLRKNNVLWVIIQRIASHREDSYGAQHRLIWVFHGRTWHFFFFFFFFFFFKFPRLCFQAEIRNCRVLLRKNCKQTKKERKRNTCLITLCMDEIVQQPFRCKQHIQGRILRGVRGFSIEPLFDSNFHFQKFWI